MTNPWKLQRVPEPEEMDEADQVESYNSAAAARHLDGMDNTFVEHLFRLLPRVGFASADSTDSSDSSDPSWGLDVGTGPAQIPIKVLARIPALRIIGLDCSPNMLACARRNAERAGLSDRLRLARADGHLLPFPDGVFSMVLCNSMLHHAREPVQLLREIFRVAAPGAPVLIRDLRRPARPLLRWHLWRHGRHYQGLMRRLFEDSVRAAYTLAEIEEFVRQAQVGGAAVFRFRGAHLGVEHPGGT